MEYFGQVFGAIIIAAIISLIFYFALNARGPWGTLWTFFLVLLFAIWAGSLWISPAGPVYWGIAWIPLFFVGLVFALLLAAIPTTSDERYIDETTETTDVNLTSEEVERRREADRTAAAVSGFFWVLLLILFIVIIIGYAV